MNNASETKNIFDPLLLYGLPYKNNELDFKKLRFYNMLLSTTKVAGIMSFLLSFAVLGAVFEGKIAGSREFFQILLPFSKTLSLILFVIFCCLYIVFMRSFVKQKVSHIFLDSTLQNLTQEYYTKYKYIQMLLLSLLSVFFGILGFKFSLGFLVFFFIFLIPKIRALHADNTQNLYAEFAILNFSLGLYAIKNDESLYYCEFNFSQSTIPLKIQQLVRCTYDNENLTKQREFRFAKTIDSTQIIEFFGKRVILQSKIQSAQNNKINIKELE
ncbi:MAG: hypothetical protein MR025_07465 [Helicobacter trogontum]|uniref:Uncharacterized protein n=1 Tax=Helicobacter trogontum TaxID=50960 RepID=A0A4U8T134_9HELI|nr:hypothetical protein [Helicobacter trogontum]MCI5787267.1 hypothetical protein [Helicobacter trogontum]TLD92964.1 hypothetical protein LS80_010815 [Helicobacter trogontum]